MTVMPATSPTTVNLSLVSHTNVGKTTLARTLLRRDVGEVRDRAHVTETAEAHVLIDTPEGDALVLWDTPGFGDSARLFRRLRLSENPIGWLITQVWDRFTDRPFHSSQQAIRNVKDESDVVLYLVNAAEAPAAAGYVEAEMQIGHRLAAIPREHRLQRVEASVREAAHRRRDPHLASVGTEFIDRPQEMIFRLDSARAVQRVLIGRNHIERV